MFLLVMVLDDASRLNDVLRVWEEAGVTGATILESTGLARTMERHHARGAYAGFSQMFGAGRVGHNTLFAVINDIKTAEMVATRMEGVLGSLSSPNTGILFVVPVLAAWGAGPASGSPPIREG